MSVQVVLALEGRRAVRALEVPLGAVAAPKVLLQQLVLQEGPAAVRTGVSSGGLLPPVGQEVVAEAVGGEALSAARAALWALQRCALVGAQVLVEVGLGLEGLLAGWAGVRAGVAVAVQGVFLKLGGVGEGAGALRATVASRGWLGLSRWWRRCCCRCCCCRQS